MKSGLLALGTLIWAVPGFAQTTDPLAPLPTTPAPATPSPSAPPAPKVAWPTYETVVPVLGPTTSGQKPAVLSAPPAILAPAVPAASVVVPKDWRGVFDAIDAGNWASAQAGIATLPRNILTPVAKAELYTAKGSPVVDLGSLQALLAEAPELPQATQLAAMTLRRGALAAPPVVTPKQTFNLGSAPVRYKAKPVTGEPYADQLRTALDPLIKTNDAAGAEAQLLTYAPFLSVEARAEAGQRVAFAYYVNGLDLDARRVADTWRQGSTGEWASQAAWISALASWRLNDFNAASATFQQVAALAPQRELKAAGFYWASRAEQAAGRPRTVEGLLRSAANTAEASESFYGLLARETLGLSTRLVDDPFVGNDPPIDNLPNVQRAVELARIGEPALAEELLRHQAKLGLNSEHHALIQLAKRLDLPAAQLWLANNGQWGARSDSTDRYPNPKWRPMNGWRVDPALAFGHIVQESSFRRTAVSGAGAVGLMQVLPITAQQMATSRGVPYSRATLTDPQYNLEFGQSFIETMRGSSATAGQLPRIIASYNAGPLPVARWANINDKGDPLLWIESIPYWETRYYVPAVLRNMWVYQGLNNEQTTTLKAMAQHRWPSFPTSMTSLNH
ncbi:lytic transglycosylase domain-containing protein [Sphingomonas flavescens]|uniref:lytic transglycosylase domain-containing protein n=1 Tax=Sphingomonas flavescens TaxID=3132797 RepID=UPI00280641FD|nr:lytic transglycosylase domain-containing protein [Sphingomonas limnosediminicola]